MSNSESSSRVTTATAGIPVQCVCGRRVRRYLSTTTENPGRPFYRCESMKRKGHLFKWVEDALVEEVEAIVESNGVRDSESAELRGVVDSLVRQSTQEHHQLKEELRKVKLLFSVFSFACVIIMGICKVW